jgi:hypothetical protein
MDSTPEKGYFYRARSIQNVFSISKCLNKNCKLTLSIQGGGDEIEDQNDFLFIRNIQSKNMFVCVDENTIHCQ